MKRLLAIVTLLAVGIVCGQRLSSQGATPKGWTKGKGWGWVWGKNDEVGSLNAMTDESRLAAASLVKQGKVYDLGAAYNRFSYKWPGHSPGEIIAFRTPEGVKRMAVDDFASPAKNPTGTAWHSCALFMNDNVATQIDGLGHATEGEDDHWYNGFKEKDWGGNWGPRKCDAETIPPIVCRGVLIDVAGFLKKDALEAHHLVTVKEMQDALAAQKTTIRPGDVVLIRTGTLRYWGVDGSDHEKIREHDSAGIDVNGAKWLVEQQGAIFIGSDTSGLEVAPPLAGSKSFMPVHNYLLIEQGVHIGEFHNLEGLAKDKAYEFCYICCTNKIKGATAGFTLRPIALK